MLRGAEQTDGCKFVTIFAKLSNDPEPRACRVGYPHASHWRKIKGCGDLASRQPEHLRAPPEHLSGVEL
jgi:hypothetical protein